MGVYLLNISVDTVDPTPEYIAEDLSFNDQESIVEIVVEKFLGYTNLIKEYDDHDTEDHNKEKNTEVDLLTPLALANKKNDQHFTEKKPLFSFYNNHLADGFIEIDSPPPKV